MQARGRGGWTTPGAADGTGARFAAARDEILEAVERAGHRLELDRRMRENPLAVLGVSAGVGFLLGGGLWPLLRPFLKATARGICTPANLLGIAAAFAARDSVEPIREGDLPKS